MHHVKKGVWLALLLLQGISLTAANPPIQLSFTFTQPTCFGYTNGTATVTATGGSGAYSYSWSNAQNGQTTYGVGAGTYFVTVTDTDGEVASGSVTVEQPAQLVASITESGVDCDGPPVTLTASGAGGNGGYSFLWNTGATTTSITASTQGSYNVKITDANGCIDNETIQVYPGSEFFVSYQYVTPDCAGNPNGSITATVFGNFPPFTYTWSNGATGPVNDNIPSGTYGLTITNAQNCTFTDNVTLQGPNQLAVDVVATDIPCAIFINGGAVVAIATGGVSPYTYNWNNGAGNVSGQQNLPAGYYAVTVTDQNGCTTTDGDTINIPLPLNAEIVSVSPSCGDSTGCVTVTGVGGTPPYTYVWPTLGLTGPTLCGVGPGDYYVCVFDANNCQHDHTVTIDSISNLNLTLITTKADCQGIDNGTATAIVTPPGGNYVYQWNIQNSPPVAQLNGIPAGTLVCVTVTDVISGCADTACAVVGTHTIVNLQVTDTTDVVCVGDSTGMASALATGGTSPYNYVWTFPDSTQVNGTSISNLPVGVYTVWVTDASGCTALGVADIGAESNPNADFELVTLACVDNQITVQFVNHSTDNLSPIVSWDWTFVWSNGSSQSNLQNPPPLTFTQNESGTATLVITSAAGCKDSLQIPFTITGIPTFTINAPNPAVDCENGPIPVTVTGTAGQTYQWSPTTGLTFVNGDPTNVIADPDVTTTYTLTVSGGGCVGTAELTIIRITPLEISIPNAIVNTCDSSATLTATINTTATVTWFNQSGQQIGSGLSLTVPAGPTATYFAVATDAYGCADTASATVTGVSVNVQIGIIGQDSLCANTPFTLQAINLYPGQVLTYQWSANPPSVTFSPNANVANPIATAPAGNYVITLVASNQFGCEATTTLPITVLPGASLSGSIDKDLCNGLIVYFTNTSGINGTWYFGTGDSSLLQNPTYTYPQAGTYTYQFIPNQGCVQPWSETIQVTETPALTAGIGANQVSCFHDAVVQFTDQTAGAPISWQWSFAPGNQTSSEQNPLVTFTDQGTVTATLIVQDANGCADTATIQLDVVTIEDEIANPGSFCPGETVALNPDGSALYTYQWSSEPSDPTLSANSPNPVVSPQTTTLYIVTITNGDCQVVDSALVIVEPAPNADFSHSYINCIDNAVVQFTDQSTGNPTGWSWTFPGGTPALSMEQNPVVTFNQEGTITVTLVVNSGGGCSDTLSQNIEIEFIDDEISNPAGVCAGGSVALNPDGNAAYTYQWTSIPADPSLDPGSPNPTVTPMATTTYYVTITNGACVVVDSAVVDVFMQPTAAATATITDCVGEATVQFTDQSTGNPTGWSWTFPGGTPATSTEQNPVVTFNQDGTVTATLVVFNGVCTDTTT
ncbi:MAG: PKD domain-containing protein, partial [Saprospiraceae bacterium]|nr:PKD domain-containing protein [Saprospiraceae bacterium]